MKEIICPISNKPFNCIECLLIVDGEKCPYMLRDEQTDRELKFLRKLIEKEMRDVLVKQTIQNKNLTPK